MLAFRLLLLVLSLLAALPGQTYRLGIDPWLAWAPAWVAQEKGMWQRHGLAVEVVGFTGGDTSAAFRAGKVDFSFTMAGTAVGMKLEHDVDVVILGEVDWSHGGDKIVGRKGKQLADCKGQRIGIYEDSPAVWMFLAKKLAADGLAVTDFEVVEIMDMEALGSQFAAGKLAFAVSFEPYVEQAMAGGGCHVIATTADFPGIMPEVVVALRGRLAKVPPAHVVAFWRGWLDAVAWAADPKNAAEFTRICVDKALFDEKVDPKEVPGMLQNVRIHARPELQARNVGKDGIVRFVDDCLQFATKRTGTPTKATAASLCDTSALQQALGTPASATPAK
jgi:NitT/TauT family transport system substrate-binding protein